MLRKSLILFFILLIAAGCSPKNYKLLQGGDESYGSQTVSAQIDYRILKHDRLAINIYRHPELIPPNLVQNGILVDSSGYISLPLIHRVHVAGLTQTEAAQKLERRYAKYLKDPALNLEVLNKRIYVLGEVKNPGPVKVDKESMTILEAIAFAGGLTDDAVRDSVIVASRDASGRMSLRKLDLSNFNRLQASNIFIKPNDVVYVQPSSTKEFKVGSGSILEPLKAISTALSPFASIKVITD